MIKIIYNNDIVFGKFGINKKTAVALGNFDGLHIGHMALINKIKERAERNPGNMPGRLSRA